jgi:8-oxo-dGTP diphosphatase
MTLPHQVCVCCLTREFPEGNRHEPLERKKEGLDVGNMVGRMGKRESVVPRA